MDLKNVQECLNTGEMAEVEVPSNTDPDASYIVLVQDPDDIEEAICECRGYEVRGYCSHQQPALDAICRWREVEGPEIQSRDERFEGRCPRCGGPTRWTMEILDDI